MADPIIPTPQDTRLLIQDTTTKTAAFNTPAIDLGAGFSPGGLGLAVGGVVQVTASDLADGNETYSFVLQESSDNVTFSAASAAVSTGAAGTYPVRGRVTKRFVRLALTVGGTTPSVTFKAWLNPLP
jgi:hypothetical protein